MPKGVQNVILACAAPIEVLENGAAKKHVRILKIGENYLRGHNVSVYVSPQDAVKIIAASMKAIGAQDIPVDYDHQLEFSASQGKGGRAEASGWIKQLSIGSDGIYADVDWTDDADSKITAKKYRYISPTIMVDKNTGKVAYIKNAGLTNQPAIDGLEVLAASMGKNPTKEENMDEEQIAIALGLEKGATPEQILAKAKELGVQAIAASAAFAAVKQNLGIDENANLETITASIAKLKEPSLKDGEMVVSASAFQEMQSQLVAITASANAAKIEDALKAGKITPAQKPQYEELFKTNPKLAEQMIAASIPVATDEAVINGQAPSAKGKLSADEVAICASLGVSQDQFLKERDGE